MRLRHLLNLVLGTFLGTFLGACASLTPYTEIVDGPLPGRLLEVMNHRVHVETAGEGEAVVLLHGFGGSTYSWRETIPGLSRSNRVIALDLFGFGFTERPKDLRFYTRENQVRLVLAVMDELGVQRAHIVGHSYGGGLATTLAVRHPERVRSLVLVDTTNPNYPRARRKNFAELPPLTWLFVHGLALRPKTVRKALERSWYDDAAVTDGIVDQYLQRLRVEGANRAYRGLTVPFNYLDEGDAVHFSDLRVPVLIVWGENDELIAIEHAAAAAGEIPKARFVSLRDCGHSPMEEQPEGFLHQLQGFFDPGSAIGSQQRTAGR